VVDLGEEQSGPKTVNLNDPYDAFYDSPLGDVAGGVDPGEPPVSAFDRAVVRLLAGQGPQPRLTFERVAAGARTGFTAAEARALLDDPGRIRHLALLWRLQAPPSAVARVAAADDVRGHWNRELLRRCEQRPPRVEHQEISTAAETPVASAGPDIDHAAGSVEVLHDLAGRRARRVSSSTRRVVPGSPSGGTGRFRLRRTLAAAALAAALILAAAVGVNILRWDRVAGPAPTNAAASPSAAQALPTSAPLSATQFVVPRRTGPQLQLYLADLAGHGEPRRLAGPASHRLFGPSLSADRRSLIYIDATNGSLRTMAVNGSGDRLLFNRLPDGCDAVGHFSWDPKDQMILLIQCLPASGPNRLMLVDLNGRLIRELTTGHTRIEDPTISPDGRSAVYWATDRPGSGGAIFAIAVDGSSEPLALTSGSAVDADPAWSPDGNLVAFRRLGASGVAGIYLMKPDGTRVRPVITGVTAGRKPIWSPDGTQLMIVSDRDRSGPSGGQSDLYLVNPDGTGLRAVGVPAAEILTPAWWHR
jgi:hypothetical protein